MASNPNEPLNNNSPLLNVMRLPDGTIERQYANGTVMNDYSATMQLHTVETWTMTATTSSISQPFQPLDTPDDSNSLLDYTPLICLLLVFAEAGTILSVWAEHKSLCKLPKPLETARAQQHQE